jgi:hypothetical protein
MIRLICAIVVFGMVRDRAPKAESAAGSNPWPG